MLFLRFAPIGRHGKQKRKPSHPFGAVLREFREKQDLTQCRVAANSGKRLSQIFQLESGRGEPEISTVLWFADAIGVPAEDIIHEMLETLRKIESSKKKPEEKSRLEMLITIRGLG